MSTFGQINLVVSDMAASVDFFRLLELDVPDPFEWPPGSGAEHIDDIHADEAYMAFDNQAMARIWNGQFEPERSRGNVVIGLMVDTGEDVDRLYEAVKSAGHAVGQEPYDAFFGSRYAIVIDRDRPRGSLLGLRGTPRLKRNPPGLLCWAEGAAVNRSESQVGVDPFGGVRVP